ISFLRGANGDATAVPGLSRDGGGCGSKEGGGNSGEIEMVMWPRWRKVATVWSVVGVEVATREMMVRVVCGCHGDEGGCIVVVVLVETSGCDGDGGVSMAEPRGCGDDGDGGGEQEVGRKKGDEMEMVVRWCSSVGEGDEVAEMVVRLEVGARVVRVEVGDGVIEMMW
ncbi:hypothetical protein Tco_0115394, partial [Tanacetum coccineum]